MKYFYQILIILQIVVSLTGFDITKSGKETKLL